MIGINALTNELEVIAWPCEARESAKILLTGLLRASLLTILTLLSAALAPDH